MSILPESQYPGEIAPSTPDYPFGAARNVTLPGDGTGTPWEAALINDLLGWQQSLLCAAGEVPSGAPDKVGASQYLKALKKLPNLATDVVFATKALLVAGDSFYGAAVDFAEISSIKAVVRTKSHTSGALGAALYEILTAADYGAVPDGEGDFYVGGGTDYVARNVSPVLTVQQFGDDFNAAIEYHSAVARPLILEAPITVAGVKGSTYAVAGGYCCFDGRGHLIEDTTSYTDGETGVLVEARAASPVLFKAKTKSQKAIDVGGFIQDVGWGVLIATQGCSNMDIDLDTDGGFIGFQPKRASSDPESYRSKNITARITSKNTHYPYNPQFSGDNADVLISANTCGRNYFVYGCNNVGIAVVSKNPQKTSFVAAFEGEGCLNVAVHVVDILSDNCQPAANHSTLRFGDGTPAEMRNIEFVFNLKDPTSTWGNTFEISKYNGGVPDTTGRGHKVIGLKVRGTIDATASGNSPITTVGTFTGPDEVDQIDFEHLTAVGGSSTVNVPALQNSASFKNVNAGGANFFVTTNDSSVTTFENVVAGNITGSSGSTDRHIYIGCQITDGSSQNIADNKTFVDSDVDGVNRTAFRQNNIGLFSAQSSKVISGSLAGPINVFKITPTGGVGFKIRLKYYLIGDQADTNPASRDETIGTKVLTAVLTSAGVWALQIPPTDEVAEISQGTPTALNVSLVNGDPTGAFVAIDAPTYASAGSRAALQIDVTSYVPATVGAV